jgi:ribosomal protein S18 acetylase RimI-like enzyme
MTAVEFDEYLPGAVAAYAAEKAQAGNWAESEALDKSAQEYHDLLPQGVETPDNYLFTIQNDAGAAVGMIWLAVMANRAAPFGFIYDFAIDEQQRRKGYGRQAMLALEDEARKLRLDTLKLHVFGHNRAARALYEQIGYEATNINMAKRIAPQ